VILASALFKKGAVDVEFARRVADAVSADRFIAAVDSRGGHVVVDGWRTMLEMTPTEAVRALEPYAGEFLYTHVDREGLMQGTDIGAIESVRNATTRRLTAAGGITTMDEVEILEAMGVDAVVGMAIYTGRMSLPRGPARNDPQK
jgi:phosphoribosylformimino-5-aminoimidazole carboxamide ribonucleotide (ProFAR) isomerase